MANTSEEETAAGAAVEPSGKTKPTQPMVLGKIPSEQAVQGFIERIEPQRVSGWACDRLAPNAVLDIDIYLDGVLLATVRADRFRRDLKSGTSEGCHGFQAFFEDPVPEQMRHRVTAVARSRNDGPATRLVNLVVDPPVRSPSNSPSPIMATPADGARADQAPLAAGAKQWLLQLSAADRKLQATCSAVLKEMQEALATVSATAAQVTNTVKDVRTTQEQLAQHLATLEVFQVRFDATLKGIEEKIHLARGEGRRSDRGLRVAVAAIAALSTASLGLGLWSILGG